MRIETRNESPSQYPCRLTMLLALLLSLVLATGTVAHAQQMTQGVQQAKVAVTIDDFPIVSAYIRTESQLEAIIYRLMAKIRHEEVPVTLFVNEGSVHVGSDTAPGRTAWLRFAFSVTRSMGNHTYSHMDLDQQGVAAFQDDILKGDLITERLRKELGIKEKYFRYPYLHEGKTLKEKQEVDAFLVANGYQIAPVTIFPEDYVFAHAYDLAELDDDQAAMDRIGKAYLNYIEKVIEVSHDMSMSIFGRPIREILLIHSNALNARYFKDIMNCLRNSGYQFITLADALEDPAYKIPDDTYAPATHWKIQRMWAAAIAPQVKIPSPVPIPDFVLNFTAHCAERGGTPCG